MCVFCKLFWFMSHFFCVSFLHGLCPPQHRPHTHNTPCTQLHSPTPSVKMKAMHWARITPTAISKTVWVADRLYCAATSRASFRLPCPPLRFKNQSRTKRHISYFPLCIIFFSGFFLTQITMARLYDRQILCPKTSIDLFLFFVPFVAFPWPLKHSLAFRHTHICLTKVEAQIFWAPIQDC